jgi:hypothetical protein
MKKRQLILSAAAAVAVASTAQAQYSQGDLLVGFTAPGATSDYLLDVGPYSSLHNGETWTLGADLGGTLTSSQFANASFGVVGTGSPKLIYSTTSGASGPVEQPGNYNGIASSILSIGNNISSGSFATPSRTGSTSWYTETDQPAGTPGPTLFFNLLDNPNVGTASPAYLYSSSNLGVTTGPLGDFTISADGSTLSFAVPEPTTFSILAGFGLLALKFRRQLARNA